MTQPKSTLPWTTLSAACIVGLLTVCPVSGQHIGDYFIEGFGYWSRFNGVEHWGSGNFSYDLQTATPGSSGQAVASAWLKGGRLSLIDLAGEAHDHGLRGDAAIRFRLYVNKKNPAAPDNYPIPFSFNGNISTWTYGSAVQATGGLFYVAPGSSYRMTLLSSGTYFPQTGRKSETYSGMLAQKPNEVGYIEMRAYGYVSAGYYNGQSYPANGGFQVIVDPVIGIDSTAMVDLNGTLVPASDLYSLSLAPSDLIPVPTDQNWFEWNNAQGGDFEVAENWRSGTGPAVPGPGDDILFDLQYARDPTDPATIMTTSDYTVVSHSAPALGQIVVDRARVVLDLDGVGMTSSDGIRIGTALGFNGLEIRNGTLTSGPVTMGGGGFSQSTLTLGEEGGLDCPRIEFPSWNSSTGEGGLIIDGGDLTTGYLSNNSTDDVYLQSGSLTLTGGATTFWQSSGPFQLGEGVEPARLTVAGGTVNTYSGLHIAAQGTMEMTSGRANLGVVTKDLEGSFLWTGGYINMSTPIVVGDDPLLGSEDLVLAAKGLYTPSVTVRSGSRVSVESPTLPDGGVLSTSTMHLETGSTLVVNGGSLTAYNLQLDPGAEWEYGSGSMTVGGSVQIGPEGLTGLNGDAVVLLDNWGDELATWSYDEASVVIEPGYALRVGRGKFAGSVENHGVFDYGEEDLDLPCDGRLDLTPLPGGNPEWPEELAAATAAFTGLRIGADQGLGDMVLNGRETVRVGESGFIRIYGGIQIDPGYALVAYGPSMSPNIEALAIDVLGTLDLQWGMVSILGGEEEGSEGGTGGGVFINETGRLTGSGIIMGSVVNNGVMSPGDSPGLLQIAGDLFQNPTGRLILEIESPDQFDQLLIDGQVTFQGVLEILLGEDFTFDPGLELPLIVANDPNFEFDEVIVTGGFLDVVFTPQGLIARTGPVPEPASLWLILVALWCGVSSGRPRLRSGDPCFCVIDSVCKKGEF
jgi:hypothetical protein